MGSTAVIGPLASLTCSYPVDITVGQHNDSVTYTAGLIILNSNTNALVILQRVVLT